MFPFDELSVSRYSRYEQTSISNNRLSYILPRYPKLTPATGSKKLNHWDIRTDVIDCYYSLAV